MADNRKRDAILGVKATPSKRDTALIKPILSQKRGDDNFTPNRVKKHSNASQDGYKQGMIEPSVGTS